MKTFKEFLEQYNPGELCMDIDTVYMEATYDYDEDNAENLSLDDWMYIYYGDEYAEQEVYLNIKEDYMEINNLNAVSYEQDSDWYDDFLEYVRE